MSLTPEQAFKVGFLYQCAQEGLTREETHTRVKEAIAQAKAKRGLLGMEKEAALPLVLSGLGALAGGALSLIGRGVSAVPAALSAGTALGVGVPVAAGASTGYLAAKLTGNEGKHLVEDAKREEVMGEYERLADEARRRARIKRLQARTGRRVIPLTPSFNS